MSMSMSVSLYLTGQWAKLTTALPAPLTQTKPSGSPSGSGGINLNVPAQPIPGVGDTLNNWIGWAKSIGMFAGVMGLIACGIMMMLGRRNRSHLAAEGATGLVWVIAGASVVVMAPGLISALMG